LRSIKKYVKDRNNPHSRERQTDRQNRGHNILHPTHIMVTLPFLGDLTPDLSTPNLLLLATYAQATVLSYAVFFPPNPNPAVTNPSDRIGSWILHDFVLYHLSTLGLILTWTPPLLLLLFPELRAAPSALCPDPSHLSERLFTWTPYTATCLGLLIVAALVRLEAFRELGTNFTFRISQPSGLVKTGLYRHVQHPSYPTALVVFLAGMALLGRPDGAFGCWTPPQVVEYLGGWENAVRRFWAGWAVAAACAMAGGWIRVKDEEALLRRTFGKEWEGYHKVTKRFIPGVI
jgi:protein-S-isoprenylcysteine O-methyltransferase Ste14